jgi:hypothetical protein
MNVCEFECFGFENFVKVFGSIDLFLNYLRGRRVLFGNFVGASKILHSGLDLDELLWLDLLFFG